MSEHDDPFPPDDDEVFASALAAAQAETAPARMNLHPLPEDEDADAFWAAEQGFTHTPDPAVKTSGLCPHARLHVPAGESRSATPPITCLDCGAEFPGWRTEPRALAGNDNPPGPQWVEPERCEACGQTIDNDESRERE